MGFQTALNQRLFVNAESLFERRNANGGPEMDRVAFRAPTVFADIVLAALAFALAFTVAPMSAGLTVDQLPHVSMLQLTVVYAAIVGLFTILFRRELSPWRYVSIPDVLVLGRVCVLSIGVFLLTVFFLDRARALPRSALVLAPMFQMALSMGLRIARRALYERALENLSPLKSMAPQAPPILLIGPPSLADTYLRDMARSNNRSYSAVGIVGTERRDVGQQVRGVCIIESIDRLDEAMADLRRSVPTGTAIRAPFSS
jgi:O-antigen biosynthesis protein WbqV